MHARHRALAFFAVGAMVLAGCAGTNQTAGTLPLASGAGARKGWISPQARGKALVYVSDNSGNAIEIYPQGVDNPSPIGSITDGIDGPLGSYVDNRGTLYVANRSNNTVTEYREGSTSPSVTLSDGISGPISVAVDSKGTVAVGEFSTGEILEFPKGSYTPDLTLSVTLPEALAFNNRDWLFAAYNVNESTKLAGHVTKCRPGYDICVDQGITEGEAGGLALDKAGDEILGDQTAQQINIYAHKTLSLLRSISTTGHTPYKFELDKPEKTLYVADYTNNEVVLYDFATGAQTGTISDGLKSAWGVSLSPPAKYGR